MPEFLANITATYPQKRFLSSPKISWKPFLQFCFILLLTRIPVINAISIANNTTQKPISDSSTLPSSNSFCTDIAARQLQSALTRHQKTGEFVAPKINGCLDKKSLSFVSLLQMNSCKLIPYNT